MENARAFTTSFDGIAQQLNNEVTIYCEDKSIQVNAIWDTGATTSCISTHVVDKLSLIATGKVKMQTPSGEDVRNTYLVDLRLPNDLLIENLVVADSEIGSQSIRGQSVGVLIGMDVICRGNLTVSNYDGKTVFSFRTPSDRRTDYAAEILRTQLIGPLHGKGKRSKRR